MSSVELLQTRGGYKGHFSIVNSHCCIILCVSCLEIGLLMNEHRQGSVKATTVCFVFCLSRDDLNRVLNQFPTLRASLEARARERLQELYLSENRPLETILALFSDPGLNTSYPVRTESEHSDLSDLLTPKCEDSMLFKCTSSILNALATTSSDREERCKATPTSDTASQHTSYASTTQQHYLI